MVPFLSTLQFVIFVQFEHSELCAYDLAYVKTWFKNEIVEVKKN